MNAVLTIIIPAFNEERYIAGCLNSLVAQAEALSAEIIVMDGGSADRTRAIVRTIAADHACIRLVDNPRRSQSAAVNLGARLSAAPLLMRADAHAAYPPAFVSLCVAALEREQASSVVVPMITRGRGGFQAAAAAAQNSRLGNGGSAHRVGAASGPVSHGHHALFDRAAFLRAGGYDESFTHNEDAELDHRIVQSGGRIWMCAEAPVVYYPRTGLVSLAGQYFRHGRGRARMLRKHGLRPRPRQLAPLAALASVAGGLALAPAEPAALLLPAGYVILCLVWGAADAWPWRSVWQAASGAAAIAMHLGWACGFCVGSVQPVGGATLTGSGEPATVS